MRSLFQPRSVHRRQNEFFNRIGHKPTIQVTFRFSQDQSLTPVKTRQSAVLGVVYAGSSTPLRRAGKPFRLCGRSRVAGRGCPRPAPSEPCMGLSIHALKPLQRHLSTPGYTCRQAQRKRGLSTSALGRVQGDDHCGAHSDRCRHSKPPAGCRAISGPCGSRKSPGLIFARGAPMRPSPS